MRELPEGVYLLCSTPDLMIYVTQAMPRTCIWCGQKVRRVSEHKPGVYSEHDGWAYCSLRCYRAMNGESSA